MSLLREPVAVVSVGVVLFWILMAVAWPLVVPYDPQAIDLEDTLTPPSRDHWFGTDDLGRDVFSRVLAGSRPVLIVAPAAMLLGVCVGTALGLFAGYLGGAADHVIMRTGEIVMAFPWIIIAIGILAVAGASVVVEIAVIGLLAVPPISRTIRAAVLREREFEYVQAAIMRGRTRLGIMTREILPNITGVIVVEGTVRLGLCIFSVATLSFLSLGVQPPSPDWALTIALGRSYVQTAAWMVLFPAAALASLVVGVNLVTGAVQERRRVH